MHKESSSVVANYVIPNSLERSHLSPIHSQPLFSPKCSVDVHNGISKLCDFNVDLCYDDHMFHMLGGNAHHFESLGYLSGYDAALDSYCLYLVDKPRKIMWSTFFDFSFDFSMALTLRGLILFFVLIFIFSHGHACERHVVEFDKLLRALTLPDLNKPGLEDVIEWLMLHMRPDF